MCSIPAIVTGEMSPLHALRSVIVLPARTTVRSRQNAAVDRHGARFLKELNG